MLLSNSMKGIAVQYMAWFMNLVGNHMTNENVYRENSTEGVDQCLVCTCIAQFILLPCG